MYRYMFALFNITRFLILCHKNHISWLRYFLLNNKYINSVCLVTQLQCLVKYFLKHFTNQQQKTFSDYKMKWLQTQFYYDIVEIHISFYLKLKSGLDLIEYQYFTRNNCHHYVLTRPHIHKYQTYSKTLCQNFQSTAQTSDKPFSKKIESIYYVFYGTCVSGEGTSPVVVLPAAAGRLQCTLPQHPSRSHDHIHPKWLSFLY